MARRPKQTDEQKPDTAQPLNESAGATAENSPPEEAALVAAFEAWDSEEILSLQINWNEKTETREIGVPLTKEEISQAANLLADTVTEIRELEAAKKASADHYKGLITDQEKIQNRQSDLIRRGTEAKPVPCRWMWEIAGRDDTGAFIRDGNYKTLIRLDTGGVVETKPITADERQMGLPLEEAAAPAEEEPEISESAVGAAYDKGFVARAHGGLLVHENPYPDGMPTSEAWSKGWADADAETTNEAA
ncbi:MAG: hypothetical protein V4726_05795 [Verrucomicrobiota bacterium]